MWKIKGNLFEIHDKYSRTILGPYKTDTVQNWYRTKVAQQQP